MALIIVLYWAVGITTLICFFVLCYNVSMIKRHGEARSKDEIEKELKKAICFQDLPQARELLKDILWVDIYYINDKFPGSVEERRKQYGYIEKRYSKYLTYLGMEFPDPEVMNLK